MTALRVAVSFLVYLIPFILIVGGFICLLAISTWSVWMKDRRAGTLVAKPLAGRWDIRTPTNGTPAGGHGVVTLSFRRR